LALALLVSAPGGCVMGTQYIPPTQQQLAAADYGAPLTVDYKKGIQTLGQTPWNCFLPVDRILPRAFRQNEQSRA